MANENSSMMVPDKYGTVVYNESVFSSIARNVIEESDNIQVAESSKMFRPDHITRIEDNKLYIFVPVRVACNANVTDVCASAQARIYESIEYMTDYKPESIEIQVVGFIF